jgi:ParB-like chromosome segregation protein Spo0J
MTTVADLGAISVVPIDSIRPAPDNPRKISDKAVEVVALSLKEFGWQQPIVVDVDGVIIAGHTRLRAAQSLGLSRVPVTVADRLDGQQVKAYRIGDNRSGDFTSWDFPELTKQLEELAEGFSDVLVLADWQAIVTEFNDLAENAEELELDNTVADYTSEDYKLTVVCDSEENARLIAVTLMDLVGVVDVRDARA